MDYSGIDEAVREDIADRVALAVLEVENLAHVVPASALDETLRIRSELAKLVSDLGGSVVMLGSQIG